MNNNRNKILLVTALIALSSTLLAADETISGNLTVEGSIIAKDGTGSATLAYQQSEKRTRITTPNTGGGGNNIRLQLGGWSTDFVEISNPAGVIYHKFYADGDSVLAAYGGRIGIGTATPKTQLHIYGAKGGVLDALRIQNNQGNANDEVRLTFSAENGNIDAAIGTQRDGSGTKGILKFYTSRNTNQPLERMRITSDGDMGIGTLDTCGYKLAVKGTIKAEEIVVETTWCDFVFDDGYELRSLSEIEIHIEEYGHLPDVPSASIVESEGLSLGEAQKIMMQKIEELTLYMIEKDKQVLALQSRVAELELN